MAVNGFGELQRAYILRYFIRVFPGRNIPSRYPINIQQKKRIGIIECADEFIKKAFEPPSLVGLKNAN